MPASSELLSVAISSPEWAKNDGFAKIVNDELGKALRTALSQGRKILQNEIEKSGAKASGKTFNSVAQKISSLMLGSWVYTGDIYFSSPLDKQGRSVIDIGRSPGKLPPKAEILAWMRIKGVEERFLWPIMVSMAKKGTDVAHWNLYGRTPFLADAVHKIDVNVKRLFEDAATRIMKRLESDGNSSTSNT